MMKSAQEAKSAAVSVREETGIKMRCLITKSSYGVFGFRFDPSSKIESGSMLNDGHDGMTEVLDIIPECQSLHATH